MYITPYTGITRPKPWESWCKAQGLLSVSLLHRVSWDVCILDGVTTDGLKSQLGKYRISRGLGLTGGVASDPDEKELEIKSRIEAEKAK